MEQLVSSHFFKPTLGVSLGTGPSVRHLHVSIIPSPSHWPVVSISARTTPRHGAASSQCSLVLQKVPSEANPKVRNHGEGPY